MKLATNIKPAIHDFSTRIEGEDMLLRMLVAVFGERSQLSYCSGPQAYNLTPAAADGWRTFDRWSNNTPEAHVPRVIEWREGLGYEALVAAAHATADVPYRTRVTAFLMTLKPVGDYKVLEIAPAWA